MAAGVGPRYGVAAALGVTFAVAVVADVTLGVFLFTMLSFLETVNAGSGAVSFIKVAGLILFVSWFAAQATGLTASLGRCSRPRPGWRFR